MFEKVQEILDKRKKPRKTRPGKMDYCKKIIDSPRQEENITREILKRGKRFFILRTMLGTNQLPRDKSTYISFETVIAEVRKAIQREMELAEQIKKKLSAREAESEKYEWLKQYSQRAWTIFEEMEQVEKSVFHYIRTTRQEKSMKKNIWWEKKKYGISFVCMMEISVNL